MLRRSIGALGAGLVLFHAWLLVSQAWQGDLAEPGLLFRWLVAGGLAAGLWGLRRAGAPVFIGRRAIALWLVAALLHGPSVSGVKGIEAGSLSEAATVAVQLAGTAGLGLGLCLLARALGALRLRRPSRLEDTSPDDSPALSSTGFVIALGARPPPA